MALSPDSAHNPLLRLYQLFDLPGVIAEDSADFLGIRNLRLAELGQPARELIRFLFQNAPSALHTCRLTVNKQPVVDFTAPPQKMIEMGGGSGNGTSTLDKLLEQGRLTQGSHDVLAEWHELLAQYDEDALWPPEGDPFIDYPSILDELVAHEDAQFAFSLEISLDKTTSARKHLLGQFPDVASSVSVLVWYSTASLLGAFRDFRGLLEYIIKAAEHPIILFFNEPTEPYLGDFFKVLPLAQEEATLTRQLETITPEIIAEYKELHARHESEERPKGGRLDLPPALFLRQDEHLPTYPTHPLFLEGPLRSLLVCALMAWLAKRVERQNGSMSFTFPPGQVTLKLSGTDVRYKDASIFEAATDWQDIVILLAHEIQRCIGYRSRRDLWAEAMKAYPIDNLKAPQFFDTFEKVRKTFVELERKPKETDTKEPDAELRIFFTKKATGGGQIDFELSSKWMNLHCKPAGSRSVGETDPKPWVGDLSLMARRYMTRILKPDEETPSTLPDVYDLENWGSELWAELIPKGLQEYYVKLREYAELRKKEGFSILIVSDDPAFPWELVKPYAKAGELTPESIKDPWLAMKFDLARWLTGGPCPAGQIGFERVCCVAATSDLTGATGEIKFFQSIGVDLATPKTKKELIDLLHSNEYDVIHFSCHGKFDRDRPDDSVIRLPDGKLLRPMDLRRLEIEENIGKSRPLIFLNVCHSGQAGPTMTGLGGWVERFVDMGCGAFIGCGWEVSDPLAAEFAVTFYKSFRGGKTLAQAVRSARQKIKGIDEANSTWLAYYLYGDPYCRAK